MPRNKKRHGGGGGGGGGPAAAAAAGGGGEAMPPPVAISSRALAMGSGNGNGDGAGAGQLHKQLHYGTLVSLLQEDALEVRIGQPTDSSVASSTNSLEDAGASPSTLDADSPAPHPSRLPGGKSTDEGTPLLLAGGERKPPKSKKQRKFFASWFTGSFCVVALVVLNGDSARGALFPTLWPLVSSLGGDRIMQGYVVSAFSVGRLIASPYIGRLSEVYGYRPVLVATTLLLALGTLLYASSTTIPHVIASQIVMGIGSGTLGVTRAWVAEQTERSKRTVLLAYLTAVQYAGFTVMPMAGGVISDLFQKESLPLLGPLRADVYTAPALLMCCLCLIAAVLLMTVFEEKQPTRPNTTSSTSTPSPAASTAASLPPTRSDVNLARGLSQQRADVEQGGVTATTIDGAAVSHWWPGRQDVVIVGGILLNVATKGTIALYETLGIEFATSHFAWITAQDAGFLFASFGLLGVLALLYMKRLCRLFNDVQLILGGMVLMVACDLLMLGGETFPVWRFYLALFLMYATGYPIGHTAVIGMFSKVLGKRPQGYLMGVFGSAGSLARVAFPIIGGHVAEGLGNNALFGGAAVFLGISGLLLLAAKDEVLHMSQAEH